VLKGLRGIIRPKPRPDPIDDDYYPKWLHKDLVEDLLPWDGAIACTFREFLSTYTLHDSEWVGIFQHVGLAASLTLCIQWDSVWLPEGLAQKTSHVADWPLLFIRIDDLRQISLGGYKDIQGCGRTIGSCEVEEIDGGQLVVISDVFGGAVTLSFAGSAHFLCLTGNREILQI
jgi:hypothetical protein